jgi:hypothetical protein
MTTMIKKQNLIILCALLGLSAVAPRCHAGALPPIQTVFIIIMENEDWRDVQNSAYAPYMSKTLLPMSSYCAQYFNPPGIHPSLPNYLWLEGGTNFIMDDLAPSSDHQSTTNHLVTLLNNAGISWKAYEEGIPGNNVPQLNTPEGYACRHDPFVYFDDVTGTNNNTWPYAIAHIRPYSELIGDLASNTVARYNFLTPNVCDDGHDTCAPLNNNILQGDTWLSEQIPIITNSAAYQNGGAIFITWDENDYDNQPIGMLILSPLAKGHGYTSTNYYTHSSTLRTMQEIFGVTPLIRDAANAADLSDLFISPAQTTTNQPPPPPPIPPTGFFVGQCVKVSGRSFQFTVFGATPGKTNYIQMSEDMISWSCIGTNIPATNTFIFTDASPTAGSQRFYRAVQSN